jgi:hypothetical protein
MKKIIEKDGNQYEYNTTMEGYDIYVRYAEEGPDREEALALFWEAQNSLLYQNLGYLGETLER